MRECEWQLVFGWALTSVARTCVNVGMLSAQMVTMGLFAGFKGPLHPSSCHKRYHLALTAECRCSKHEGTIWSSANRWQAARWCHTHSLVCWKIHGLGCHSGPHLCCIILVADSNLGSFCS